MNTGDNRNPGKMHGKKNNFLIEDGTVKSAYCKYPDFWGTYNIYAQSWR